MSKSAVEKTTEIKLGCVTYLVEREFVGTVSREELLVSQLIENTRKETSHPKKTRKSR